MVGRDGVGACSRGAMAGAGRAVGRPWCFLQPRQPGAHVIAQGRPAAALRPTAYSGDIGKEELTMSEDANKMGAEALLIHLEPEWERRNWCKWLGCSEAELEHAVTYVGHDPDNVRRFLRQAR